MTRRAPRTKKRRDYKHGEPNSVGQKQRQQAPDQFFDDNISYLNGQGPKIKTFKPKGDNQKLFFDMIGNATISIGMGPAGTGKTHVAVARAVQLMRCGLINKIVLTRPAIEAGGERLGFLPGDLNAKLEPYLYPLFDEIEEFMGKKMLQSHIANGTIEIIPLGFMRGRTFKKSVLIVDEAQNASKEQLKMAITRIGEHSKIVLTGDPGQSDIGTGGQNGLSQVTEKLKDITGVNMVQFDHTDQVRNSIITPVLKALDADE